jgi:hypothetical protein
MRIWTEKWPIKNQECRDWSAIVHSKIERSHQNLRAMWIDKAIWADDRDLNPNRSRSGRCLCISKMIWEEIPSNIGVWSFQQSFNLCYFHTKWDSAHKIVKFNWIYELFPVCPNFHVVCTSFENQLMPQCFHLAVFCLNALHICTHHENFHLDSCYPPNWKDWSTSDRGISKLSVCSWLKHFNHYRGRLRKYNFSGEIDDSSFPSEQWNGWNINLLHNLSRSITLRYRITFSSSFHQSCVFLKNADLDFEFCFTWNQIGHFLFLRGKNWISWTVWSATFLSCLTRQFEELHWE